MDAAPSKRGRPDEPSDGDEDAGESVIGLDVGGQLFYTHKSTLTAGSAYFAARFGGTFSAGESYEDERGRTVYFVDADAKTFEHILTYLRRGIASWPDEADEPKFHDRLVAEAEYFGVEAMLDKLQVLASIAPNASGKGILYWLGTSRHKGEYQNPYEMNEFRVAPIPNVPLHENYNVSAFFEYRPPCEDSGGDPVILDAVCDMLSCDLQNGGSRQFNFVDVAVKPTHYSLRYGSCSGMSDWNFEASVDGNSWDTLHEARKDRHLLCPCHDESSELYQVLGVNDADDADGAEVVSFAERHHRHIWAVNSSRYYEYFRFVGLTREQLNALYGNDVDGRATLGADGRILFSYCVHGVGFELYGDVKSVRTLNG